MARFPITNGPDRSELSMALFGRRHDRPLPLDFTITDAGNHARKVKLHVTSVGIEDGSGHSWIVEFQSADFMRYYKGYYRTDQRTGWIEEVEESSPS